MRRLIILVPFVWMAFFYLAPFLIVMRVSFSQTALAIPPFAPVFHSWSQVPAMVQQFGFENYLWLLEDDIYWRSAVSSLTMASVATGFTLAIGYPLAYALSRAPAPYRVYLVIGMILPFWTAFLIRVYAWIGILKPEGFLNQALRALGLISEPLVILNTNWGVLIGIVYSYLPFMVLPIFAVLDARDRSLLEAAADLGASPLAAFWHITFPMSLPGVVAGCLLVFIPAVGEFVIPDLLGGSDTLMIGTTLWNEFFRNRDWPVAAALAIVLLAVLMAPILALQRPRTRAAGWGR